jgi:SAM-dependent methyltransferase
MIPNFMTRQIWAALMKELEQLIFDKQFVSRAARHPHYACIAEWLSPNAPGRVLELGCGPGKYVAILSALGFEVVGVDPFEFPSWRIIQENTTAELRSGIFAEQLPFPDRYFDHAACIGALLYFNSPQQALGELRRVVKPGGRLVLRTVNKSNLYTKTTGKKLDPESKNLYDMDELVSLVNESGFRVEHKFSYGFWPPILTNLWWYLVCVWLPLSFQELLSSLLKPENHVNNTIFATRI